MDKAFALVVWNKPQQRMIKFNTDRYLSEHNGKAGTGTMGKMQFT